MTKVKTMKTSELLNELAEDLPDDRFTELEEELANRPPFSFIDTKLIEIDERLTVLEKKFDKHRHIDHDIVVKI